MNAIRPEQLRLYAVTDRSWLRPGESLETVVKTLLQNGVTCLQLREKHCTHEEMVCYAQVLAADLCENGVPLILNDDVQAAVEAGADGVHVGQKDMSLREAPDTAWAGKDHRHQCAYCGGGAGGGSGRGGLSGMRRGVWEHDQDGRRAACTCGITKNLPGGAHPGGGDRRDQQGQPAAARGVWCGRRCRNLGAVRCGG